MREVSSERYKNFYPGSTSGIYQHRRGAADFLSDFLVYSIPVELRREIPLGWRLLALLERDEIRIRKEINYPFSKAEVSRLKGVGTYPVGKTIVKAKQWAFGLRPIHLSRAFESGEAPERGKNGKQHDPVAGSTASMAKRDIAKKLISRLTVCELLYDPRVLLFGISYYLANKTLDAPLCAISSKNVQNVVIRLVEEFCKQHDA
ncbi:hypothetical protein ALC57_10848 [Trachymyrmex cornetzi]|uniref:Uncharacterized protein n=1 Tax=Trachymyrmex cornetzi TaxID=471704 RepID=A0A195DWD0_9HYME|nr:hypothetical protein ALC57_10848 [Trachymyrmex cornetzi]